MASFGGPQSSINGQVIRFADVLLMLAESYIQQGNFGTTPLGLINKVRQRSGAVSYPNLGASQTAAMSILMRERQLELCGEQSRYFDLIRWGIWVSTMNNLAADMKANAGTTFAYGALGGSNITNRNLLFPIPASEISVNSLATQNPGW